MFLYSFVLFVRQIYEFLIIFAFQLLNFMNLIVDRTVMPAINDIADFKIKKPKMTVMRNGMKLYVMDAGTEDVVRLDLVIGSGQLQQDMPLQAMMTNRMLREGTGSMSSAEIAEKLDFYGAWLDLSSSVNSGFVTLYSLGKYFEKTVEIVADMVRNPVFPERELRIVTDMNRQQFMVNAQRVEVMARKKLNVEMFGKEHPLGRFAEYDDYDMIDCKAVTDFYLKNYHSGNCSVYVSGRVTENVLKCVERCFGTDAWGQVRKMESVVLPSPSKTGMKRVFVEKEDALQSSVKMGLFVPERKHHDFLDLRVAVTLLGGYFGSRLMKNIREDKGYTYGIGAGIVSYPGVSMMIVTSETANEYVEPLISEVYREIGILKSEPVGKDELNMVKNYMLGDLCRAYENVLSLSDAWIFVHTSELDEDFFERSADSIRNITEKRIMELANLYLKEDGLLEVVAGKCGSL